MVTVSSAATAVNGLTSLEDVIGWVKAQGKKGDLAGPTTIARMTALRQMGELVAPNEPSDAKAVLAAIPRLQERYARKNPDKSTETAAAYANRARVALEEFFKWQAAPDKYEPPKARGPREKKVSDSKTSSEESVALQAPQPIQMVESRPPANVTAQIEMRNFPLGDGRAIHFALPPEGASFEEMRKFAVHVFTLASDFNVASEDQIKMFGMVVRGT